MPSLVVQDLRKEFFYIKCLVSVSDLFARNVSCLHHCQATKYYQDVLAGSDGTEKQPLESQAVAKARQGQRRDIESDAEMEDGRPMSTRPKKAPRRSNWRSLVPHDADASERESQIQGEDYAELETLIAELEAQRVDRDTEARMLLALIQLVSRHD